METKHTPWEWKKCRTVQHLQDRNDSCFAQISMPIRKEYEEYAAFILRACNNHDKLLEACKDILGLLSPQDGSDPQVKMHNARKVAEAAIAEADNRVRAS